MNTKHTPGPWHTTGKRNGNGMFRVYADGNGQIGAAYTYAEGDASLIAAAPDLLAAHELANALHNVPLGTVVALNNLDFESGYAVYIGAQK